MGAAAGVGARAHDRRPHLAAVPDRGREGARARRGDAGRRPAERRRGGARGRAGGQARHPGDRLLSLHRAASEGRARDRGLQRGQSRLPRLPGDQGEVPRARPRHRRGARPLHQPRPRRARARARRRSPHPQRRDGRGAGPPGAQSGARRRRRHRPLRHDGRPGRRDPRGARRGRLPRRPDPRLRRQIRLRLLWAVPRRARLQGRAERRQAHLPDGPGQQRRGACARSRSTSRRAPTW